MTLSGRTSLYPILGDPVTYVESPRRLTAAFEKRRHDGVCVPMQIPREQLDNAVRGLCAAGNARGLLITMPHKAAMFAQCATTSETATLLGVVSVARRNPDGTWHGDMLDGEAFVSVLEKAGAMLRRARVLQVGAGGAGSAISLALCNKGVQELVLHDTNPGRSDQLVKLLSGVCGGRVRAGGPDAAGFDIVVNATPLGMSPDDPLPVEAQDLSSSMVVGDVIAGHGVTPLLQAAHAVGCRTASGSQMVEEGIELMCRFFLD